MRISQLSFLKKIKLFFYFIICTPHLLFYLFQTSYKKAIIKADVLRWNGVYIPNSGFLSGFIFHLCFYPEFRNLFYYRIGAMSNLLNIYCGKMSTLYLSTSKIGAGLFIQHGFATVIAAESIGKNCWINQQVTVGFSNKDDCPIIEDNVTINAGAKVIGGVVIGSGSVVGANAVVVKNVPENCVVVGVPAFIIKRNGLKVNEKL
jgi:serine O-acetyltransferase